MGHLLYLMFRCDFDVMESLEEFGGSEHSLRREEKLRRGADASLLGSHAVMKVNLF